MGLIAKNFKPAPAKVVGPTVVKEPFVQARHGEIDVSRVAMQINPEDYAEEIREAEERAKNRRFK